MQMTACFGTRLHVSSQHPKPALWTRNDETNLCANILYVNSNVTSTACTSLGQEKEKKKKRNTNRGLTTEVFSFTFSLPCYLPLVSTSQTIALIDFQSLLGVVHQNICWREFYLAIVAYIYMPLISPGAGSPPKLGAFIIVIGVGLCALVFTRLLMRSFREWSKMKPYPQVYEDKTRRSGKKEKKTRPFPHH